MAKSLFLQEKIIEAQKFLILALELNPTDLNNLVLNISILISDSKLEDAQRAINIATQHHPNNLLLLQEQAQIYFLYQDYSQSLSSYFEVIKRQPFSVKSLYGIGCVYEKVGRYCEAIEYFNKVILQNPKYQDIRYKIGYCYFNMERFDEAIIQLKKAVVSTPNYLQAYNTLAYACIYSGRLSEAKNACKKILEIYPGHLDTIATEANIYNLEGCPELTYKLTKPFIDKKTLHPRIGAMFAAVCNQFESCESAIEYLESTSQLQDISDGDKQQIFFALGDLYDKRKLFDLAFENYQLGNHAIGATYDHVNHAKGIDAIISTFSSDFFQGSPVSTCGSDQFVFVVGMPRSGTTLVEQIIASHPAAFGAGELPHVTHLVREFKRKLNTVENYPLGIPELSQMQIQQEADSYFKKVNALSPKARRITDKTPHNFLHLGLIYLLFPNAKIIHCKRDPRDTAISIYFQNFSRSHGYATELGNIAYQYVDYEKIMAHWEKVLPIEIHEVRYEELILDTEKKAKSLIEYCELDWSENCLNFYDNKRPVITASHNQVIQPIYSKSMDRWKNYEEQLAPFIQALSALR